MKKYLITSIFALLSMGASVAVHAQITSYGPWQLIRSKSYEYSNNGKWTVYCHYERKQYISGKYVGIVVGGGHYAIPSIGFCKSPSN